MRKRWKTLLAVGMSAAMLFTSLSGGSFDVSADDQTTVTYDNNKYELHTNGDYQYIVADGKAVIVKYLGTASSLAVPSAIDGYTVETIGYTMSNKDYIGAFAENESIQSVIIPESVKVIDACAFYKCNGLQQVLLGSGVTKLGEKAFGNCTYMQKIQFTGNQLQVIGDYAFFENETLDEIVLPSSVVEIGKQAFNSCISLTSIDIPDSVVTLGESAFTFCTALEKVTIGDGVTELKSGPSRNSKNWLGSDKNKDGTFENCSALREITLGSGLTNIGIDAFSQTALETVTVPDNVITIEQGAFFHCDSLKTVYVGNGAKTIGDYAFFSCDALEEIQLGKRVKTIGTEAFRYCRVLKSVVLPSSVEKLGGAAFAACNSLVSVDLGNGVQELLPEEHLEQLWWYPDTDEFSCEVSALYTGYENEIDGTFEGCVSLESVTIGNGVKTIGKDAFACTRITELDIPDNVVTLDSGAFTDCRKLKHVTIGDGVTSIGTAAFIRCSSLLDVKIGRSVATLGDGVFLWCRSLQELNLPSNITSVGGALCAGATSLKKVIVGNGITSLSHLDIGKQNMGSNAEAEGTFEGCVSMSAVALGSGLTSIGTDTFSNTQITSLFIPNKVSNIGSGAFFNSKLESIYFAGAAPSFGTKLFGESQTPFLYKIAGKKGYDNLEYEFNEYTPIKVKFDSNGVLSTLVSDQIMGPDGGYVIEPIPLAAENYLFLGWYADAACTRKWDFMNDKVTADTTLYAKWVKTSEALPQKASISDSYEATDKSAKIQWLPVSGATGYKIYKDGVFLANAESGKCEYTIANLEADTSYEITVTAVNNVGESEPSLVKVVQTSVKSEEDPGENDKPEESDKPGTSEKPEASDKPEESDQPGDDTTMLGDLDGDKKVQLPDAQIALKAALKIIELNADKLKAVDVNHNKEVDLQDAQLILKYALKIIDKF